jgi:hypothetical protein
MPMVNAIHKDPEGTDIHLAPFDAALVLRTDHGVEVYVESRDVLDAQERPDDEPPPSVVLAVLATLFDERNQDIMNELWYRMQQYAKEAAS